MSTKYKLSDEVPSGVLADRLDVLSDAVTQGIKKIGQVFYMSIPAEVDHDADLVISGAAKRIRDLEAQLSTIQSTVNEQAEDEGLWFDTVTAPEAFLQQALRRLHSVIKGEL